MTHDPSENLMKAITENVLFKIWHFMKNENKNYFDVFEDRFKAFWDCEPSATIQEKKTPKMWIAKWFMRSTKEKNFT